MVNLKSIGILLAGITFFGVLVAWNSSYGGLRPDGEKSVPTAPGTTSVLPPADDEIPEHQSDDNSKRWFKFKKPGESKGVALVIHGLNLQPTRMEPIISRLTESGIDVLSLSLRGHGDNFTRRDGIDRDTARLEAFKKVSYQVWINEAYLAFLQVKKMGEQKNVPVFLTAFSIGGLIGLDLFASNPDVMFDRMVLFAPAIKVHGIIYLERILSPFPSLVIPSLADESYLANKKGTPIAAYNALFEGLDRFEKNANSKINVSTLIFVDREDEFIPLWGLRKLVKEKKLDQWSFYTVEKEKDVKLGTFHHHIIDGYSTGKEIWEKMMQTTILHLLGDEQD